MSDLGAPDICMIRTTMLYLYRCCTFISVGEGVMMSEFFLFAQKVTTYFKAVTHMQSQGKTAD